jgi:hypothetical protein
VTSEQGDVDMIFGNPNEFAIQVDLIPEWSSGSFHEGIFCIYLNSYRLSPMRIRSTTLKVAMRQTLNALENLNNRASKLSQLPELLKNRSDKEIFDSLYELTYPSNADDESVDNCWDYVISPDAMTDSGFGLFIYENESNETVLGGAFKENIATAKSMPIGSTLIVVKKANDYVKNL